MLVCDRNTKYVPTGYGKDILILGFVAYTLKGNDTKQRVL